MGLLDDAIREHLDLKRRRGADPAEIERAEREALGPVRRNGMTDEQEPAGATELEHDPAPGSARDEPDESIAGDLAEESPDDAEPEYAAAGTELYEDETTYEEPEPVAADLEPLTEETPAAEYEPRAGRRPRVEDEPPAEDDPHRTQVMRAVDIPAPAEHDAEGTSAEEDEPEHPRHDTPRAAEPADDEDVLEETPEFLQDTPDHDRLWFEQRPPRDFDFDG